jgi:hypothetical protein
MEEVSGAGTFLSPGGSNLQASKEETMSPKTHRPSAAIVLSAFCLFTAFLSPLQAAEDRAAARQEFQGLLERVKKSDASVDFAKMRQLQTRLDDYSPYDDSEDHPFTLLKAGNVERAQALADRMLAKNYLDLEAHFAAAEIAEKRKDEKAAAHHRYVIQGVLDSILKSGDGNSPKTAYVVVNISEEYALMGHFGLRVAEQSLINDEEGHSYDLLRGADAEGKPGREVYFNIDALMGALSEEFSE